MSSASDLDEDAKRRCGHCDNCLRSPESISRQDVTLYVWQVLKLANEAQQMRIDTTLQDLVKTSRGNKSHKLLVKMDDLAGGPVRLSPIVSSEFEQVYMAILR